MAKLGTQFQPITNPAGTRLLTLIDESTGLRYKINITDFFALVDAPATFNDGSAFPLTAKRVGSTNVGLTLENDTDAITLVLNGVSKALDIDQNVAVQKNSAGVKADAPILTLNDLSGGANASAGVLLKRSSVSSTDYALENNAGLFQVRHGLDLSAIDEGSTIFQLDGATGKATFQGAGGLDVNTISAVTGAFLGRVRSSSSAGTSLGDIFQVEGGRGATDLQNLLVAKNNIGTVFQVSSSGTITALNLAGTGTRNVVVDANGVMSAP